MSNAWVVFAYVVVYGTIVAYAAWLGLRLRAAHRGVGTEDETLAGSAVVPPLVVEE